MTPEVAEYYRALLLVGLNDRFEQYFDEALETEDPLSDVILALSSCISDRNQVLSVLREYTLDYTLDDQVVIDLILEDLRGRYQAGKMSRTEIASVLYRIVMDLDHFLEEPWNDLTVPSYALELFEIDMISEEVFNQCFDAWLFHGKRLEPWELQRKLNNPQKRRCLTKLSKK